MSEAIKDDGKNLEVLKKALKENDYKLCGMGVDMMLSEMKEMGLPQDAVVYWKTLGMANLPYNPSNIK